MTKETVNKGPLWMVTWHGRRPWREPGWRGVRTYPLTYLLTYLPTHLPKNVLVSLYSNLLTTSTLSAYPANHDPSYLVLFPISTHSSLPESHYLPTSSLPFVCILTVVFCLLSGGLYYFLTLYRCSYFVVGWGEIN